MITGFVHADPHEGNLKYMDDGRICFLDFGLMDRVSPKVMVAWLGLKTSFLGPDV